MKARDAEILIIPGYTNAGPDHWQTRWERGIKSARRVEQTEWSKPVRDDWVAQIVSEANKAEKPLVFVAHSLGIPSIIHALPKIEKPIKGLFMVSPPDVANAKIKPKHLMTFGPYPTDKLELPSILIASKNDPFCDQKIAQNLAETWGSLFIDAGEAGHINADSGHGPWPEGSLTFAKFLSQL